MPQTDNLERLTGAAVEIADQHILTGFLGHAEKNPDQICLIEDRREPEAAYSLTYAELAAASRALAEKLRTLGARPGVLVGVRAERSCALFVGIYGALLAGSAFLVLDPELPEARLRHLVDDSRVALMVQAEGGAGEETLLLPGVTVTVDRVRTPGPIPLAATNPDEAAYVMYTSGSTGRPKGVVVSRYGLLNRIEWMQAIYGLNASSRVLAKTPLSFDVCIWELFWPLSVGATCVLARHGMHGDADYLARSVDRFDIDTVHFVPAMLNGFLDAMGSADRRPLRRLFTSGERLTLTQAARVYQELGLRVHNLYGPTEATVDVTAWTYDPEDGRRFVPIGHPIWNTTIELRDEAGCVVPAGGTGEIVISGPAVALGYIGDGTLDRGRFTFGRTRVYRTGDLARVRAGGVLEFLGRTDAQVKINGQRVELEEIESTLARHPAVQSAAVHHTPSAPPVERLTAYLRLAAGRQVDVPALRDALAMTLPRYMMPTRFVVAPALPYSASGKLDRKALPPAGGVVMPEHAEPAVEPRDGATRRLVERTAEVLGTEPAVVPIDADLFYLGLDSITVLRLVAVVRRDGLAISAADVFGSRTIAKLVDSLAREAPPARVEIATPMDRRTQPAELWHGERVVRRIDLARLQQGQIFHRAVSDDYLTYVTTVELRGHVATALIQTAVGEVVSRHEMLRSAIDVAAPDGPQFVVLASAELNVIEHDLRGQDTEEQELTLAAWRESVRRQPFEWQNAPLFEVHLHRVAQDRAFLSLVEPLLDGWSVTVLMRDVLDCYEVVRAEDAGVPVPATARRWLTRAELPSYADFVRLEQDAEASPATREFWRERISSAGDVRWNLAVERDPSARAKESHRLERQIAGEEFALLVNLAERLRVPVKSVLLAAHVCLVSMFSGGGKVGTGVTVNGRPEHEAAAEMCGLFLNVLPLLDDPDDAPTVADLVYRMRDWESATWRHRRLPYATIIRDSVVDGMATVFNFTNFHWYGDVIADEDRAVRMGELVGLDQTYFDLTVQCSMEPQRQRLAVWLETRFPIIADADAARMLDYYLHLLREFAIDPDRSARDIPLVETDEAVFAKLNATGAARTWPEVRDFASVVDEHARTRPDAVAVIDDVDSWTYAQVSQSSIVCATALLSSGVGENGPVVAVLARRTVRLWVTMLGIWRAGGTYLPLSPDLPPQRAVELLTRAGVALVVTDDTVGPELRTALDAQPAPVLDISISSPPALPVARYVRPAADCAYIVFTSGSTGAPKGARIGYQSMINHIRSKVDLLDLDGSDVVAQNASMSFDQSLWQCTAPWLVGGTSLVVADELMLAPARLLDVLTSHGVTIFETVPSHLDLMLEAVETGQVQWPPQPLALSTLLVSGEAMTPGLTRRWFRTTDRPVVNAYGATECADDFTHAVLHGPPSGDGPISVGSPVPNCMVEIVGAGGRRLPVGVDGELQVSGQPVGLGYVDPEHEAGRFVDLPAEDGPRRVYRTGDLMRIRKDGELVWLSRIDDEVKVHGHRLSLSEVEHHLVGHGDVSDAVVLLVPGHSGERLRAVATGECAVATGPAALRTYLTSRLPQWMVPDEILTVPRFPLTRHGKVDRAALAALSAPASQDTAGEMAEDARLASPVATVVKDEWCRILGQRPTSGSDFFRGGGGSLDAVRLAGRVSVRLGVEVDAAVLLKASRFEAFVREVTVRLDANQRPSVPEEEDSVHVVHSATDTALLNRLPGKRIDAAAISCIPAEAIPHSSARDRADIGLAEPLLTRVVMTPAGAVGCFVVPITDRELFSDPGRTAAVVSSAVRRAGELGARRTALTGMLATSVDYGRALLPHVPANSITTGHDVVAAAVVLNVTRALTTTGTTFDTHDLAVVGLGSVGRAATLLALDVLGRPRRVILVEAPGRVERTLTVAAELAELGCNSPVECLESDGRSLPADTYAASLIIDASSSADLVQLDQVRPGGVVLNIATPMSRASDLPHDLYVVESSMFEWPGPLSEIRWQPEDTELAAVTNALPSYRQHGGIASSLVASILCTGSSDPSSLVGEPDPAHLRRTYDFLVELGFGGVSAELPR